LRVLQINTVANSGSTGRIAEEIGNVLMANGHESYIAYGRGKPKSSSKLIKIGTKKDMYWHGAVTLFTDRHGFASKGATEQFIKEIDSINPDLIALHNLHGYYINIDILFRYIKEKNIPVTWTLHDCWPFTGHCTYYDDINCQKWQSLCHSCPKTNKYPKSFIDNSTHNYNKKKYVLNGINKIKLITPSIWLKNTVIQSFLNYDIACINNGINLDIFLPIVNVSSSIIEKSYNKKVLLSCASPWSTRKGYHDLIELSKILSLQYQIVMIGLNKKQIKDLPKNIIGIERTESTEELAQWYTLAHAFVNPTSQDNFPTTNLEALACGTPVITYNTGGSPEAIDEHTGYVVEKGDVQGIIQKLEDLSQRDYSVISKACRDRAERLYNKKDRYLDYLHIFENMVKN
jgi:putative colanic acid biosynthesis glycosyltransferase